MEKYRIVYYDNDGNPAEAMIEAEEGQEAVDKVEDMGRLLSVESMGPVEDSEPEPDRGSASYPWGSREERLENEGR